MKPITNASYSAGGRTETAGTPRATPGWVAAPAIGAPVALIGGWTVAAAVQPEHFSSINGTISDLAATTTHLRWIMTLGLIGTGTSLLATAVGLVSVANRGRIAIGIAGAGILLVAAEPIPGGEPWHGLGAFIAFGALAVWPVLSRRSDISWLRSGRARWATSLSVFLLLWLEFAQPLAGIGGLMERLLAGGEVSWLAVVAIGCIGQRR